MTADEVRYPSADTDLDERFLFEAKRKVQKDRTVSLDSVLFELDAALLAALKERFESFRLTIQSGVLAKCARRLTMSQ